MPHEIAEDTCRLSLARGMSRWFPALRPGRARLALRQLRGSLRRHRQGGPEATGVQRESLHWALSPKGNPPLNTCWRY